MKSKISILNCVLAALLLTAAAGCQREGPAQKAGKQVDSAVAKAGDKINDAVDKLKK
jgi:uncharacterized protein YjbJ (UPF0337 family)